MSDRRVNEKIILIKRISIRNYKGIDSLEVDFPLSLMGDETNICVLGSKNGLGKTSLLECVALLVMAAYGELEEQVNDIDLDFIRAGAQSAVIRGTLCVDKTEHDIKVSINSKGKITTEGLIKNLSKSQRKEHSIGDVLGISTEPVNAYGVFFIHGYRKIQEGRIDLGRIVGKEDDNRLIRYRYLTHRWRESTMSTFKASILEWQLSSADLLDYHVSNKPKGNTEAFRILEQLLDKYANVKLGKIRPYGDGTMSILVVDKKDDNVVFPIDGLSSGQKEIISTLFMIWENTRNKPSIVLIDEPELHLNTQWHRTFIDDLLTYAPCNQYIIATHSEQIMDSVDYDSRMMLQNNF